VKAREPEERRTKPEDERMTPKRLRNSEETILEEERIRYRME
jgi:hypothetical protein